MELNMLKYTVQCHFVYSQDGVIAGSLWFQNFVMDPKTP